jgi:hypothetical protein
LTVPSGPRDERSSTVSAALLDPLLSRDPVGPRITYYDDASGDGHASQLGSQDRQPAS